MFTGIVTELGIIQEIVKKNDWRIIIGSKHVGNNQKIGASVSCNGICLTIVEISDKSVNWFAVQVSHETVACTNIADWKIGDPVNLERSLRVGDELGGHIVTGHIDGVARIVSRQEIKGSVEYCLEAPHDLIQFIASKGSIALDGVSLTVNIVSGKQFTVNIIPHTLAVTRWGMAEVGNRVNLEVDTIARYVARIIKPRTS